MQYTLSIEINRSVEEVAALFKKEENLYKWMKGLQKIEHLSGEKGQPGAKSRLTFQEGKRTIVMTETVISNKLPDEMVLQFEAKGVFNIVKNKFRELSDNQTEYTSDVEFRFSGFMKLIAFFMPGAFKKQTWKHMEDLKKLLETGEG